MLGLEGSEATGNLDSKMLAEQSLGTPDSRGNQGPVFKLLSCPAVASLKGDWGGGEGLLHGMYQLHSSFPAFFQGPAVKVLVH
jgi:hypothetical protein